MIVVRERDKALRIVADIGLKWPGIFWGGIRGFPLFCLPLFLFFFFSFFFFFFLCYWNGIESNQSITIILCFCNYYYHFGNSCNLEHVNNVGYQWRRHVQLRVFLGTPWPEKNLKKKKLYLIYARNTLIPKLGTPWIKKLGIPSN